MREEERSRRRMLLLSTKRRGRRRRSFEKLKKAVDATSLSGLAQQPSSHKPLKAALTQTENATAGVARWPVSLVTTLQTI